MSSAANAPAMQGDGGQRDPEVTPEPVGDVPESPRGRRGGAAMRLWGIRILLIVVALGLWEYASGRWVDEFFISRPTDVADYVWTGLTSGVLLRHIRITLTEMAIGFVFGVVFGLAAGITLSRFKSAADILDPFIAAANGIPRVALGPLMIVWFGIGITSKVVLVFSLVVFLVFYNTYGGLRTVSPDLVRTARSFGASDWKVMWKVSLPSTVPWIMTAIKLALPYALIGAIVGEFIASSGGLGYLVQYSANLYDASASIGIIVVMAGIIMILNAVLVLVERIVLRGRPEQRGAANTGPAM